MLLIGFGLFFATVPAFAEPDWNYFVKVGSFWHSDPPKDSEFFKIQYRITDGTVKTLETNNQADIFVDIASDTKGKFEILIPKNYPYTNYNLEYHESLFDITVNDAYVDTRSVQSFLDCHYVFSIPFSGDSKIKITWNADYQNKNPWFGDPVDESCLSETIVNNLQDSSSLIPIHFTYPGIVTDFESGKITLPLKDDKFTALATDFRTKFNGYTLPYEPTSTTRQELADDNFQEFLKRNSATELLQGKIFEIVRIVDKLEQEREIAKLLDDKFRVTTISRTIGALEQQIAVYDKEVGKLYEETNLLQEFNVSLYAMDKEKEADLRKAQSLLEKRYLNPNSGKHFITLMGVDTMREALIIGVNVNDDSISEEQYIKDLSKEIREIIGNDTPFVIEHSEVFALIDVLPQKTLPPYQQFKQGTSIGSIKCDLPLELHVKDVTKPICIKPETFDVLIKRGYEIIR